MDSFDSGSEGLLNRPVLVGCGALLAILFCLNFAITGCESVVGLAPAYTLVTKTYVWNVVTSSFYESNIGKLIFDFVALWWTTSFLRTPNLEQFGMYFGFTLLACAFGTSTYCFVRFFATGYEELLISPVYGFNGILITLTMLLRQQLKNQAVHPSVPFITFQNVPALLFCLQLLAYILHLTALTKDFPFSIVAFFFSWSYLRFYYRYIESDPLGDKSEDFAFVAMFPEVMHIFLIPLSTAFYNIVALTGMFPVLEVTEKKTFHHLRAVSDPFPASEASPAVPAKVDVVAERRRAKALKLLDAKMAELSQEPEGWGDDKTPPAADDIESVGSSRGMAELSKLKV